MALSERGPCRAASVVSRRIVEKCRALLRTLSRDFGRFRDSRATARLPRVSGMSDHGLRPLAARAPHAPAVIDGEGRTWTRTALLELADRLAHGFAARGLAVGDVLALAAPNCAEYLAAYLAGLAAGLYVVPINWHLAEREVD
jgi:non-ribosomal peptide synthetase component E (peptide arylation enzyme)